MPSRPASNAPSKPTTLSDDRLARILSLLQSRSFDGFGDAAFRRLPAVDVLGGLL